MVHPGLKKFPCLTHSGPKSHFVFRQKDEFEVPVRSALTPEEAERAMGYSDEEVGVTAYSAEKAIKKRICCHDFERDGCVVSLRGCADQKDSLERVDDKQRLKLLGNSQVVTLLEALIWNDRRLFPAVSTDTEDS